ncbi:MAG: periplasmic heavy metal sensor [Candidatus Fermentibacterota bacterium]
MDMRKGFRRTAMITAAAALMLAAAASAQPMMGEAGGPRGGGRPRISEGPAEMAQLGGFLRLLGALDLTEEQRGEIRTVFEEARDDIRAEIEGTRSDDGRRRMLELFASPDLSESEVLELMAERDGTRDSIRRIVARALADIHDLLTEEQLARLAEMVEEGPPAGGSHGGPGGGMHGYR